MVNGNEIVINKIKSMEIDEKIKIALEEIFNSEIRHGNSQDVKKYKINHFREIINKRMPQ